VRTVGKREIRTGYAAGPLRGPLSGPSPSPTSSPSPSPPSRTLARICARRTAVAARRSGSIRLACDCQPLARDYLLAEFGSAGSAGVRASLPRARRSNSAASSKNRDRAGLFHDRPLASLRQIAACSRKYAASMADTHGRHPWQTPMADKHRPALGPLTTTCS
jgi:hypothetical protein